MKLLSVFLVIGLFAGCSSKPKVASNTQNKMRAPAATEESIDISNSVALVVVNTPGTHASYVYTSDKQSASNVWSPVHSEASVEDAKSACAQVTELNLKWSLPTTEEFLKAFNNSNVDETTNEMYPRIFNEVEKSDTTYWTATQKGNLCNTSDMAQVYYVHTGQLATTCGISPRKFRCIGHKKY